MQRLAPLNVRTHCCEDHRQQRDKHDHHDDWQLRLQQRVDKSRQTLQEGEESLQVRQTTHRRYEGQDQTPEEQTHVVHDAGGGRRAANVIQRGGGVRPDDVLGRGRGEGLHGAVPIRQCSHLGRCGLCAFALEGHEPRGSYGCGRKILIVHRQLFFFLFLLLLLVLASDRNFHIPVVHAAARVRGVHRRCVFVRIPITTKVAVLGHGRERRSSVRVDTSSLLLELSHLVVHLLHLLHQVRNRLHLLTASTALHRRPILLELQHWGIHSIRRFI
mmetsp:Transcript_13413/g.22372  ORF Transcript_13413/g.22372 Transcript_13413/m.22372 type:complete len:273 (-) Transcript_13413:937-1755(-)